MMHIATHPTLGDSGSRRTPFSRRPVVRSEPHRRLRDRHLSRCHTWWPWNARDEKLAPESHHKGTAVDREQEPVAGKETQSQEDGRAKYIIQTVTSLDQVSLEEWNACLTSSGEENPFLLYEFLSALEHSGCTTRLTGWMPFHLIMRRESDDKLVGCCPLYVKSHSQGEYVFDYQWAQLSAYTGKRYYPKLQSCVPFTPVTGSRLSIGRYCSDVSLFCDWTELLVNADVEDNAAMIKKSLADGLKSAADSLDVSSAHLTFNSEEEQDLLEGAGYFTRLGLQYHWENKEYETFDAFLMALRQSKRKNIRQERKSVYKSDVTVERLTGGDIKSHHWDTFYEFYRDTCDRKWGDAYLNREFFHMIGESMNTQILLVLAKKGMDGYVAGAWNCIGSHALFGRNWGKKRRFECKNLHFELCYYQAIEAAIEMGLSRVEAGAQGEHKIQRGYLPKPTYSSHYIRPNALKTRLQDITRMERMRLMEAIEYMELSYSPFK